MEKEIRWVQRFTNYKKALAQLEKAVEMEEYSELEREGVIQRFEYTFELGWKTLQDLLEYKGYKDIKGPRPVIMQSFQDGLIENGEEWLKMLEGRQKTSHTYNVKTAEEILNSIKFIYYHLLQKLLFKLDEENGSSQASLF